MKAKRQRGAAAVEFALVLPTFMLLLTTMITLGRAYWTEFLMLNITSQVARACVLQQQPVSQNPATPSNSTGALTACANTTGQQILNQYHNLCGTARVTMDAPQVLQVPGGTVPSSPQNQVRLLQITMQCKMPVIGYQPPGIGPSVPLLARSAMPFIN